MQRRALAQAAEILKANRAAARVAKARKLSPAFDAECRKAERPVGFWQWAGYIHGRCRGKYIALAALGVLIWFLAKAAAFLWLLVKASVFLIPAYLLLALTHSGPFRRRYRRW